MKLSKSLLYLLLLYCVVDKENKLSTTSAILIASVILLATCFCGGNLCPNANSGNSTNNPFALLNTI